jgi:hypothetical protein
MCIKGIPRGDIVIHQNIITSLQILASRAFAADWPFGMTPYVQTSRHGFRDTSQPMACDLR